MKRLQKPRLQSCLFSHLLLSPEYAGSYKIYVILTYELFVIIAKSHHWFCVNYCSYMQDFYSEGTNYWLSACFHMKLLVLKEFLCVALTTKDLRWI